MRVVLWAAVVLGVAGIGVWFALLPSPEPTAPKPASRDVPNDAVAERIGRYPRSQFYIERDRFLPATEPTTVTGGEATFLAPDSEVFGVVIGGHARAYPVPMISYHHVVNDVINGIPVAITY